ncbi:MAG: HAD hydrolase-like protein [Actinomycetaceae bacterium]|nr:HAD hydrolase-like protein [Actinomycetaceae bacterium]
MKTKLVVFDVDGTITDSAKVITDCVSLALAELGLEPQTPQQLKRWVGPPLSVSFRDYTAIPENDIDNAIATYRSYYADRMLDAPLFPGIRNVLQQLQQAGMPMAVATSKIERMATPILEHHDIAKHFQHIAGSREDEPNQTKASVIADALSRMRADGYDTEGAIMIGDRIHDVEGAHENNMPTIGILWSGTDKSEFETACCTAKTPADLLHLLEFDAS